MENKILCALTDVRDDFIMDTMSFLGYKKVESRQLPWKKGVRVFLIAAMFLLLAGTAVAVNLFGLDAFLSQPFETVEPGGYLSINGFADSSEGKAAAAWEIYRTEYSAQQTNETDHTRPAYWMIYGILDETMDEHLSEIAAEYGLSLHTRQFFPADQEQFLSMAGIRSVLRTDNGVFQGQYVFEDGSFKGEGWVVIDDQKCDFTLIRGHMGTLAPFANYMSNPEDYVSWQYTASTGVSVDISVHSNVSTHTPCFLFFHNGEYFVSVYGSIKDNSASSAEDFAESFDFMSITQESKPADMKANPIPQKSNAIISDGLLTFDSLQMTPEWKAAAEWNEYCNQDSVLCDIYQQARALYGRGNSQTDAVMEALGVKYGLHYPQYKEFCVSHHGSNRAYPNAGNGITREEEFRPIAMDDFWDLLGSGPLFDCESVPITDWYDTGAFYTTMANTDIYYLPKGVLFTYHITLPESFSVIETWEHKITEDVTVCCVRTDRPESFILYETELAYVFVVSHIGGSVDGVQRVAEQINFSCFK